MKFVYDGKDDDDDDDAIYFILLFSAVKDFLNL